MGGGASPHRLGPRETRKTAPPAAWWAEMPRKRLLNGPTGWDFAPRGDAVGYLRYPREIPKNLGGSPTRRPAGPAARGDIPSNSARSTEIQRNRHLPRADGRAFAPRGSVADCVESSGNPEEFRLVDDAPPGWFYGSGGRSRRIPPSRPKFSASATSLGRSGGISHLADLRPIA